MKAHTFATLVSQHPVVRPVNEIAVWTWIAGAIFIVCVLAAVMSPDRTKLAGNSAPWAELLSPPLAPPPTEVVVDPSL